MSERGFIRGHVDRDNTTDDLIWFTAATEGVKADGIDLRMDGAQLERFTNNPIILFGHNAWGRSNLPIGRAPHVSVEGKRLKMGIAFDQEDTFAVEVERKIRNKFLNAVSISFNVLSWENPSQNHWNGGVATKWELFETSVVPVPMDGKATVESGRAFEGLELGQLVRDQLVEKYIREQTESYVKEYVREYLADIDKAVPVGGPKPSTFVDTEVSNLMASFNFGGK